MFVWHAYVAYSNQVFYDLQMPAEAGDGNISDGSAAFDQIVSHDYSASSGSPLSFMTNDGQCLTSSFNRSSHLHFERC